MQMRFSWILTAGLHVSSASLAEPNVVKLGSNIEASPDFLFKTNELGLYSIAGIEKAHEVRVEVGDSTYTLPSVTTIVEQNERIVVNLSVWPLPEKVKYSAAITQLEEILQSLGLPDDKIKDDINMRRAFKHATRYTTFEIASGATLEVSLRSIDLSDHDIKKDESKWWIEMTFFAPKE